MRSHPTPPQTLGTDRAVDLVQSCGRTGRVILGLDGFELGPEGYVAKLDLILDLSSGNGHLLKTCSALAYEAETFIKARAAPNIVWEIVIRD